MRRNFQKRKRNLQKSNYLKLSCMLLATFLLICIPRGAANAATGLKLYNYNTKKVTNYTDTPVKVTYNGTKISVDATPGILVNGTALVSYYDIFAKSLISTDYKYSKDKGTVTISKNGITIVMTLNSKVAYVNGKAVTISVAPQKVKFMNENLTKILVPSRFLAEALGYYYTWNKDSRTASIQKKSINIAYNGKELEYTGTQGLVSIDGKSLNLGSMPSIITNDTAMLRVKKVFADSSIDATYNFNQTDNTVTLIKDKNKLVMTIGSKVAYLNGITKVLDTAPMLVKNCDTNISFIMVPGTFTATCLGYDYVWNKSIRTSTITSKKTGGSQDGNDSDPVLEPELGGDDSNSGDVKTLLQHWQLGEMNLSQSSNQHSLNNDNSTNVEDGFIYSITRDYTNVVQNAETFMIVNSSPFGNVTSNFADKVISIQTPHTICQNNTIQTLGINSSLVSNISMLYNQDDLSTSIKLSVLPEDITYDLTLSADKLILYVTLYTNTLTDVSVSSNSKEDLIMLTGFNPINVSITRQDNLLYIDLPYTVNGIGAQYTELLGARNIHAFYTTENSLDQTRLIVGIDETCEYTMSKDQNKCMITFTPFEKTEPTEGGIDPSKYEIIIPRPAGVQEEIVTDEDYYYENKFSLKIPGDYTGLLTRDQINCKSSVITNVSVFLNSNYETEILFSTSKLQGYEIVMDNNYIYINIGNPRDIYKNIVVLDAGHGGGAPGAIYKGIQEKNINFKILYEIGKNYFNTETSEIKVYYTRSTDVEITLSNRAAFADKVDADLFVSLHMNASTASSPSGTEVYYSLSNNRANNAGLTSHALASFFVNSLTDTLGTKNRGTFSQKYTVVHKNTVPAVLIELGFMSNSHDLALITNQDFQNQAVKAIYDTLCKVFELYPTGR